MRLLFALTCAALAAFAPPALARDPILSLPLDCTLGQSCYIQNYMDHDPSPGAADLTCGPQSYDGHKGTDFALNSLAQMQAGVAVRPAAPGTVRALRDGMEDLGIGTPGAPETEGRECGNGVVVDHGGGWESQYCHMKQGTIAVQVGQRVGKRTILGQVGLSGQTEFPHLHLSLRHDGAEVDPFLPSDIVQCGVAPPPGLWEDALAYTPGGLIAVGIAARTPAMAEVLADATSPQILPPETPMLAIWALAHGTRAGDRLLMRLISPKGAVLEFEVPQSRAHARAFSTWGRRAEAPWPEGPYTGEVVLLRDGAELDRKSVSLTIAAP